MEKIITELQPATKLLVQQKPSFMDEPFDHAVGGSKEVVE
jgi:hypothetical protein